MTTTDLLNTPSQGTLTNLIGAPGPKNELLGTGGPSSGLIPEYKPKNPFIGMDFPTLKYLYHKTGIHFDNMPADWDGLALANEVLAKKGHSPITSASQAPSAFQGLIAKRNAAGGAGGIMGTLLGTIAPIALQFIPGIGTVTGALLGAAMGAGGAALSHTNPLLGAALGGLGGGFAGAGGLSGLSNGAVMATSGPMAGQMVIPGVLNGAMQAAPSIATAGVGAASQIANGASRLATGFEGTMGSLSSMLGGNSGLSNINKGLGLAKNLAGAISPQQQGQQQVAQQQLQTQQGTYNPSLIGLISQLNARKAQGLAKGGEAKATKSSVRQILEQFAPEGTKVSKQDVDNAHELIKQLNEGMLHKPYSLDGSPIQDLRGARPLASAPQFPSYYGTDAQNITPQMNADELQGVRDLVAKGYARGGRTTDISSFVQNLQGLAQGGQSPRTIVGPGDGMSDGVPAQVNGVRPAALSDGEHVTPALQVAMLGRGSTKAGSARVEDLIMKEIQKMYGKGVNPKTMQTKAMRK